MTPALFGSEPAVARYGKYQGTAVLQTEQEQGLRMIRVLNATQHARAILSVPKTGNNNVAEASKHNVVLDYARIRATELSAAQKEQLLGLVALHVGNMADRHATVKMAEVRRHLDNTWFAWIGGTEPDSVFYYRIQSPVLLVEFDHQLPIALRDLPRTPNRDHIHTVVRTSNGNDYGKDVLRQHYARHPHPHDH